MPASASQLLRRYAPLLAILLIQLLLVGLEPSTDSGSVAITATSPNNTPAASQSAVDNGAAGVGAPVATEPGASAVPSAASGVASSGGARPSPGGGTVRSSGAGTPAVAGGAARATQS